MENSNQNTVISNEEKLQKLREELRTEYKKYDGTDETRPDQILKQIRDLEALIKNENKIIALKRVNREQAEHRAIITDLLSLDLPIEDITTNDGSFHAVKLKKHPLIIAFMVKHPYAKFSFNDGFYKWCKIGGEQYYLGKTIYEYGKADEFKKFETFSESCDYHGFLEKEMSFSEFIKLESAILKESQKLKNEIKKSEEKIKSLQSHFLTKNNLLRRYNLNTYEYSSI
jgi:hypothetical protein